MGDILHALPAVTALREAHPSWIIDWVVDPRWRALLVAEGMGDAGQNYRPAHFARPVVDRIHLAATREWRKSPFSSKTIHEIMSLRQSLKAGQYDVVLDLQGAIRSAVVGRFAGSRRMIGEAQPRERAARWLFTERVVTRGVHVIEQDVELAAAVAGDDLKPVQPWLPVDAAAEAWANEFLGSARSRPSESGPDAGAGRPPVVLINPGAGWGAKRWPVERYATVAQSLIERGFRVFVNSGPGEEALSAAIVQQTGGAASPLACSLGELIAFTRRISLAIAGDTGPLHLACALGRPVVGIYGPTDPSRNGPFGSPNRVLRSPESRRDHSRHAAPEAGLLTIQPQDVLQAAEELMAQQSEENGS